MKSKGSWSTLSPPSYATELDQEVSKKDRTQGSTHLIEFWIVSLGLDDLVNNLLNLQLQTLWPLTVVGPSDPADGTTKSSSLGFVTLG